jgi:hypothetical protein
VAVILGYRATAASVGNVTAVEMDASIDYLLERTAWIAEIIGVIISFALFISE